MPNTFISRNPSVLWFLAALALFTFTVTILAEATGSGLISTSFVKTLGKTLCLCLIAIAMDVVWGYCGILSLGHFAFFGIGGYAIGMWLMYERTNQIVTGNLANNIIPPTPAEITDAIGTQIFGVVGSSEFPAIWAFADSLTLQLLMVVLIPGLLALVFGWLAFRSRVTGVYLSILTQAMTLALALYLFQNDSGLRGNNGLSGLQNIPGLDHLNQAQVSPRGLGRDWWAWAALRCCPRCDLRVAPVQLFHRRQRTRHQPWGLRDQMDRLVACPAWPVLRRGHALLPRRNWQPL